MDAKSIGLVVAASVAAVAVVSAAWLGNELIESRATVKDLQATVSKLDKARNADDAAISLRDNLHQEAKEDARQKLQAIESIPHDLPDSDYLDALRRSIGLLPEADGSGDNPTAKPDAGLPHTASPHGTPEN